MIQIQALHILNHFSGGPRKIDPSKDSELQKNECYNTPPLAFAMPYEVGFVIDFEVEEGINIPKNCGTLSSPWKEADEQRMGKSPYPHYIHIGTPKGFGDVAEDTIIDECKENTYMGTGGTTSGLGLGSAEIGN